MANWRSQSRVVIESKKDNQGDLWSSLEALKFVKWTVLQTIFSKPFKYFIDDNGRLVLMIAVHYINNKTKKTIVFIILLIQVKREKNCKWCLLYFSCRAPISVHYRVRGPDRSRWVGITLVTHGTDGSRGLD